MQEKRISPSVGVFEAGSSLILNSIKAACITIDVKECHLEAFRSCYLHQDSCIRKTGGKTDGEYLCACSGLLNVEFDGNCKTVGATSEDKLRLSHRKVNT